MNFSSPTCKAYDPAVKVFGAFKIRALSIKLSVIAHSLSTTTLMSINSHFFKREEVTELIHNLFKNLSFKIRKTKKIEMQTTASVM